MKESIQDAMPSISPAEIRRAMNVFVIACAARLRAEANHRQQFFFGSLYLNKKLYLGFHWNDLPATLHVTFSTHTRAIVQVWLLSVTH